MTDIHTAIDSHAVAVEQPASTPADATHAVPADAVTDQGGEPGADATPEQREHWTQRLKADAEAKAQEAEQARREVDDLRRERDRIAAQLRRQRDSEQEQLRSQYGEIDPDNPDDDLFVIDPEYRKAVLAEASRRAETQAVAKIERERKIEHWTREESAFAAATPDYDAKVNAMDAGLTQRLVAELAGQDGAPAVLYTIASTPAIQSSIIDAINNGNPAMAYVHLGRAMALAESRNGSQQQAAAPARPKLPPVIPPVHGGGAAGAERKIEDMSMEEHAAAYRQRWAGQ